MENDWDTNKWYRYRTIERFAYRNRLRVATLLVVVGYLIFFAGGIITHIVSENGKLTDLLSSEGIALGTYGIVGLLGLFVLLGLYMIYEARITKNQRCPKCKRPCADKESATTGQMYLVCHECKLKWDAGINNSSWE
jgi:hypothetical protein